MSNFTRRKFLVSAAGVSGAAALTNLAVCTPKGEKTSGISNMRMHPLDGIQRENLKISDIKVTLLSYELKPEEQWTDGDQNSVIWQTTSVITEVFTDVGIVGIGGGSRYNGPVEMKTYTEKVIKPLLIGKNPFDVAILTGGIAGDGARAAWCGVDVALWDIIGKAKGLPLYKILATNTEPQTHLRVYASGGEFTWRKNSKFADIGPESHIRQALQHKKDGYTAFKFRMGGGFGRLGITLKDYIPHLYKLREAVGPDFDLIQEANTRWSVAQCLEICPVLEELKFLWFEEPTKRNIDDYLKIKQALPTVKISGGEMRRNRGELAEWIDSGAYDIIQSGCDDAGMTENWHIAQMAHTRGRLFTGHNWQDGLVTIANAHLLAALPNRFLLETNMTANPLKEGLFKEKLIVKNGYLDIPDKPGLGVELIEDLDKQYPYVPGPWNKPDPGMPKS
ncbi:MAG: mandelate racemase/muconate lactonizing enzyme family protein [Deltaproteobacteria bacterium]|nr:mandelate racemase/muconate lactonizing enzyme family protein [Deltaproteobacteria bacterium]